MTSHLQTAQGLLVPQNWRGYTPEEHATWRYLYERQSQMLQGRACDEFLHGLQALDLGQTGIPDFARLSESLRALTGWSVVAVPGLIPDEAFFALLANRQFPAGRFIRKRDQLDYLQEPDVFHDVFGHVPMLAHPVFADYMQAYGEGGLRSLSFDCLHRLARLYWYTVEFGLIRTADGLRIYGSGIVSSYAESVHALESPIPRREDFDLKRVMRTPYCIDRFQDMYFVIDSFDDLLGETYQDFAPIYRALAPQPDLSISAA
ncbi:MAG: phenylalanine 4-monooxygenase [Rhodospirillaceae bacterium]|nr:phenylalanine 4-monooxygenase [Rhodospirillaceae bacterium]